MGSGAKFFQIIVGSALLAASVGCSHGLPKPEQLQFEKLIVLPPVITSERQALLQEMEEDPPMEVETTVARYDLNRDDVPDFCASHASSYFGNTGARITCYVLDKQVVDVIAAPEYVELPGSMTGGYYDLTFGGPGFDPPKIWKWDGERYR